MPHPEAPSFGGMLIGFEEAGGGKMRIIHDVGEVTDRLSRDLRGMAARNEVGGREAWRQPCYFAVKEREIAPPRLAGCERVLIEEARIAKQFEYPRPAFVGVSDDAHVAVGGRERLAIGIDLAKIANRSIGRVEGQTAEMLKQHEIGEDLEHRNFNELTLASPHVMDNGGEHRVRPMKTGDLVGDQRGQIARADRHRRGGEALPSPTLPG